MPETPDALLVTGCYRSGTTLVEKILHTHPRMIVASQPFPVLYHQAKAAFDRELGLDRRYSLGHLFLEDGYRPAQLEEFLDRYVFDDAALEALFDAMDLYDGVLTPEMRGFRGQIPPGSFFEIYRALNACIARLLPKRDPRYVGAKEVLVEELAPYLLARGTQLLFVIRDPRDMIASLNFRDRGSHTGADRPILFSLRAWRKSVALAFAVESAERALVIRYEDLVRDTATVLERLTDRLALEPFPRSAFDGGLRDQHGQPWRGNSSFGECRGISTASLDRFTDRLPREVLAYVEACCWPEMRALGYQPRLCERFDADAIRRFHDPFPTVHPAFDAGYSSAPQRAAAEIRRVELLSQPHLAPREARRWFIRRTAYERLRAAGAGSVGGARRQR